MQNPHAKESLPERFDVILCELINLVAFQIFRKQLDSLRYFNGGLTCLIDSFIPELYNNTIIYRIKGIFNISTNCLFLIV